MKANRKQVTIYKSNRDIEIAYFTRRGWITYFVSEQGNLLTLFLKKEA